MGVTPIQTRASAKHLRMPAYRKDRIAFCFYFELTFAVSSVFYLSMLLITKAEKYFHVVLYVSKKHVNMIRRGNEIPIFNRTTAFPVLALSHTYLPRHQLRFPYLRKICRI